MKLPGCVYQCIHFFKVVIVGHAPAHMLPDIFLRVQFWRVRRQPLNLDLMIMLLQHTMNDLGIMSSVIVHEQRQRALRMSRQFISARDRCQQTAEADIVATPMDHLHGLSGYRIDSTPIPVLACPHARRQDDPLLANARPAAGDGGQQAQLGRITKQQDVLCICLRLQISDFFFSPRPVQDLAYA